MKTKISDMYFKLACILFSLHSLAISQPPQGQWSLTHARKMIEKAKASWAHADAVAERPLSEKNYKLQIRLSQNALMLCELWIRKYVGLKPEEKQ